MEVPLGQKLKLKKLTTYEGIQHDLLRLDDEQMCCFCMEEDRPTYAVVENTEGYPPVYINDEEEFCVAEDYVIIYPFVYVKRSRKKNQGEVIANIHLH